MNWSKAKTILIVAFIVTNIFLLTVKINRDNNMHLDETRSEEFAQKVVKLLGEKGIKIKCNIPSAETYFPLITVKYESYDSLLSKNLLAQRFVEEYVSSTDYKSKEINYVNDDEVFTFNTDFPEIKYTNSNREQKVVDKIDAENAELMCLGFLKDKGYSTDDIKLTKTNKKGDNFVLQFTKYYNNILIEESYMIFKVNKYGIRSFKRKWLEVLQEKKSKIKIGSSQNALLRLLSTTQAYNKDIVDISMCYFFSSNSGVSSSKHAIEGDAIPSWRVEMSDGQVVIIEEY